jgi:hypothetical protein
MGSTHDRTFLPIKNTSVLIDEKEKIMKAFERELPPGRLVRNYHLDIVPITGSIM